MNTIVEELARALWEIVPWRMYDWDKHPNEDIRKHYRARANRLLSQFDITAKESV